MIARDCTTNIETRFNWFVYNRFTSIEQIDDLLDVTRKDLMADRPIAPQLREEDTALDRALRPTRLADFPGQERLKENLGILIQATRQRGEALDA